MPKKTTAQNRVTITDRTPKYKQLTQVALLLDAKTIAFLNQLERTITAQRSELRGKDVHIAGKPVLKERRLTKNAIIRCLIALLAEHRKQLDLRNIINEDDLTNRLRKIVNCR